MHKPYLVRKPYLILFVLSLLLVAPTSVLAKKNNALTITVSASPEAKFQSRISVQTSTKLAERIISCKTIKSHENPELPRAIVTIGQRTYLYDTLSRLFETTKKRRKVILPSPLQLELEEWVKKAEALHFGQLSNWNDVKTEFRRMSFANVIDLETGESFRVQRRAGTRHADVQPLTKTDSSTMKDIYQGKWSWKRRAILVEINGKHFAASMHGMPHGAGAIKGNDFPGHFCIHFQGSSTHLRKEEDPSHQFMILKASGRLPESIQHAEPDQLVSYFLTSLHEGDLASMAMMGDNILLPFNANELESFKWNENPDAKLHSDLFALEIPVQVRYQVKGWKVKNLYWTFVVTRGSLLDRWKISDLQEESKGNG